MNPFKPDAKDPMKVKRNFAICAFAVIVMVTVYILVIIKTGDEKTAANMSAASGVLIILLPTLATPIAQYFYMTGQKKENKNDSIP